LAQKSYLLAIETSDALLSLALVPLGGQEPSARFDSASREPTSTRLVAGIDFLLRDLGLEKSSLGAVAVNVGPGSFTGLRIGVMVAKTLAHDLALPLYAVPGLLARAHACLGELPAPGWPAVVMADARRGQVFGAVYAVPDEVEEEDRETAALGEALFRSVSRTWAAEDSGGNGSPLTPAASPPWRELMAPSLDTAEVFLRRALQVCQGSPAILCCDGALMTGLGEATRLIPPGWEFGASGARGTRLTADSVAALGLKLRESGLIADAATLEPRYIREPDAKMPKIPQPE